MHNSREISESGTVSSLERWVVDNLYNGSAKNASAIRLPETSSPYLRVIPIILFVSSLVVAFMWYREAQLSMLSQVDKIGYPLMFIVTLGGSVMMRYWPRTVSAVMFVTFLVYILHVLGVYYSEMFDRLWVGTSSTYEMTITAIWLPLGYIGSVVFFNPRVALMSSLTIYAVVALPQLAVLVSVQDEMFQQEAVAILVSQPVYILALWSVGLMKLHVRGVNEQVKHVHQKANLDLLTKVPNRRAMQSVLDAIVDSDVREPVGIMLLDVDKFKNINDTYGHGVGDEVLTALAETASKNLRSTDLIGRWGGEEFMVISYDQTPQQLHLTAERLRTSINSTVFETVGSVTVSIGITNYQLGEDIIGCINRADDALYMAKNEGRNRVVTKYT